MYKSFLFFLLSFLFLNQKALCFNKSDLKNAKQLFETGANFSALKELNSIAYTGLSQEGKANFQQLRYYVYYSIGDMPRARQASSALWDLLVPTKDKQSIYTAQHYAYLSLTYHFDIRADSALYLSEEALKIVWKHPHKTHLIDIHQVYKSHASACRNTFTTYMKSLEKAGKSEELEEYRINYISSYYDSALVYCKKQFPSDNIHTATLIRNYANYYLDLLNGAISANQKSEVEKLSKTILNLYYQSSAILKTHYNTSHPGIAHNLLLSSLVYTYRDKLEPAIELINKAQNMLCRKMDNRAVIGSHYLMLTSYSYLSFALDRQFKSDSSQITLQRIINANHEACQVFLEYALILKSSDKTLIDAYNLNPFNKLTGTYFQYYKLTGNANYCDSVFENSEKCKQLKNLIDHQISRDPIKLLASLSKNEMAVFNNGSAEDPFTLNLSSQNLESVQSNLKSNEGIFYYTDANPHISNGILIGLVATRDKKHMVLLSDSYSNGPMAYSINKNPLFAYLTDSTAKSFETFSKKKYHELIAPLIIYLSHTVNHLYITPDFKHSNLPFEILKNEKNNFLLNKYSISYNLSYHFAGKASAINPVSLQLFLPDLKKAGLTELPFCGKAASDLSNTYEGALTEPTKENLAISFKDPGSVMQLICHSICNLDDLKSTFLLLGDYKLSLEQVKQIKVNTPLLILSSCETDYGWRDRYEGQFSFTKAFLESGAKCVMSTAWKSDDKATAEICSRFYSFLSKGLNKAEALRQAKISFINDHPSLNNPLFWAPLKITGDIEPLILKEKSTSLYWYLLGLPLLILIPFKLRKKR